MLVINSRFLTPGLMFLTRCVRFMRPGFMILIRSVKFLT